MNLTRLSATIAEAGALRHTPAGLPALDMRLEHESRIEEGGQSRQVKAALKAVALGTVAERLARQTIGSHWCFSGFLASPRLGKHVVLHIQDFQQDQIHGGS
ncbi:MAG: primosomal replication protein N [Burkholderiaceae bacterium]